MTQSIPTGTFGVAKFVVSADATQGSHTTIGAAITSASATDTIWILPGIYTENLTGKAGVTLKGVSVAGGNPQIVGLITMSVAGTFQLEDILLKTNGANAFATITGSNASAIVINNCFLSCASNSGIVVNNSTVGSGITLTNCTYDTPVGFPLFTLTTGTLIIENVVSDQVTALSSTASTMAAGTLEIRDSFFSNPITLSGGTVRIFGSVIDQTALNAIALTVSGATVTSRGCSYLGGSASAVSITSGTLNSFNDIIDSSNTNAVTGAGTIVYSGMIFSGSSVNINTTTQTGGIAKGVNNAVAPAAGFIGESISAQQNAYQALTTATVLSLTSINLTAGRWAIYALGSFNATGTNTTNVSILSAIQTVNNSIASLEGHGMSVSEASGVGLLNFNGAQQELNCGPYLVNISTTTQYFLNVEGIGAVSFNMQAAGTIRGIRIG